jgi:RNA polymerase sigma factor (sigma-70 family)
MSQVSLESDSSSAVEWQQRIEAARAGCRVSQNELLSAVRPLLSSLVDQRFVNDKRQPMAHSDVVQEVLVLAWQGLEEFRGHSRGELVAWLKTILKHRVNEETRSSRKVARHLDREALRLEDLSATRVAAARPANAGHTPSEYAMANEKNEQIERVLAEMPPRYEQSIRLRDELGLTFRELGVALSCSEDAARKLWSRAIERLGRELQDGKQS